MIDRFAKAMGWLLVLAVFTNPVSAAEGDKTSSKPTAHKSGIRKIQRLLLLGQSPDGHPHATHEYMPAARLMAKLLQQTSNLQTIIARADEPWKEGPELLDGADAAVLFVSQGAKWLHDDPARLTAFQRLAKRGGGLVVLHWGMGTTEAKNIAEFVKLFGGCHGGPDRKYKVVDVTTEIATPDHPIMYGIEPIKVHEEFYYTLKFAKPAGSITPLLQAPIEGKSHTVAWAWERPDGGRSFGFSGLHFHKNWEQTAYRRMVIQSVLWTLKRPIPKIGLPVKVTAEELSLPAPEQSQKK